jgi:2-polyprenyl-3-methyl-5-hydroxy-6-metoxy-1,4-benzoquinol methylase
MHITAAEWADSQAHELAYWRDQYRQGNPEQAARWHWYANWLFVDWFYSKRFDGLSLLDFGSGPMGVLSHIRNAARRVAVDPLMTEYRRIGYDVEAGGIVALAAMPAERFDVIFCLNVLDHTDNPGAVLTMLAGHLAHGGCMVFCVDLRPPKKRDACHKINLTDKWTTAAVCAAGLCGARRLVPHQGSNPTMQWCAVLKRKGDA